MPRIHWRFLAQVGVTWWLIIYGPRIIEWLHSSPCDPLRLVTCE